MQLIKTELYKATQETLAYYPDFIVSIIMNFILYLILLNSGFHGINQLIGFLFWILVSGVLSEASISISSEKQSGTLQNLLIKPYSILTILISKTIAWFLINFCKTIIVLLLISFFTQTIIFFSFSILLILILSLIGILGIALLLASLTMIYTKVASFESIISYLLLFLSGNFLNVPMPIKLSNSFSYGVFLIEKSLSSTVTLNDYLLLSFISAIYLIVGIVVFHKVYNNSKNFNWSY